MFKQFESLIASRARDAGYPTVDALFTQNPGEPYGIVLRKVARRVNGARHLDIPLMAVREFHRKIGIGIQGEREYAKDALTRSLREHLGAGWGAGPKAPARRAHAYAEWNSLERDCEDVYGRVWDTLASLKPPPNWRPGPKDDPLLEQAFALAWPLRHCCEQEGSRGSGPG